jgi:hypothetical protein
MDQGDWWRYGIFYQIYPHSFQDSNGDGVGDINGVIARLPYLKSLGINAVWLSPIFPSPMADFGYDVSDYTGIDPLFGTMADFDALVAAVHESGLKIVLDLVPNHTSNQHLWFAEARTARDNPKRDWYIWRDPKPDGGLPNNWLSEFGGSAWQYDEATGQYYYHAFLATQPDLNWRNPKVREAIYDAMRFWLRKGVDGFRVDVMWHLIKDSHFRDNPPNPHFVEGRPPHEKILTKYSTDQPEVHEVVAEMRRVIDEFDDRVLIGEIYLPLHRLVAYYGNNLAGAQMPFNFALLTTLWSAPRSSALSPTTNAHYRRAPGRTGCSAITIARGLRAGLGGTKRGSRRCCCLPCGARRRFITGMRSACIRSPFLPIRCAIPLRKMCPASVSAVTVAARPCSGTRRPILDFRRQARGCHWPMITSRKTWSIWKPTQLRF